MKWRVQLTSAMVALGLAATKGARHKVTRIGRLCSTRPADDVLIAIWVLQAYAL